jgi:hypothetical protein
VPSGKWLVMSKCLSRPLTGHCSLATGSRPLVAGHSPHLRRTSTCLPVFCEWHRMFVRE